MRKSRPQSRPDVPWSKRWQIPDRQIVDVADQYEKACRLLLPESGVLPPLINLAAVSIELYLKSLSAERIYTPHPLMPDVSVVTASASVANHTLTALFKAIFDDIRTKLIEAYRAKPCLKLSEDFLVALERLDGAFSASRYPFEPDKNVSKYDPQSLGSMAAFLRDFVHALPPMEMIECC
jgi:hypothetical protein